VSMLCVIGETAMKTKAELNNRAVDCGKWSEVSGQENAEVRTQNEELTTCTFRVPRSAFCVLRSAFCVHPSSRGFTLIEVLLTLCLLVIMGAMAWPQLDKAFSNNRLRNAADIVRIQWGKARVEAMSTGCMRLFRYEIEGNHFRLEGSTDPMTDPAATDAIQLILADQARSPQNNANLGGTTSYAEMILPEDVVFVTAQTETDTGAVVTANNSQVNNNPYAGAGAAGNTNAAGSAVSGAGWSEPIIFYPDGTASNTRLMLRNKNGRSILLELRGLTGVVKVGEIRSASQGGNL
jgi:prepilin-type N-terminal cleavage/methylation domain-containing protein